RPPPGQTCHPNAVRIDRVPLTTRLALLIPSVWRSAVRTRVCLRVVACLVLFIALVIARNSNAALAPSPMHVATSISAQTLPRVVDDGSGGMLVAWLGESNGSNLVYVLKLSHDGSPAPGWPADGVVVSAGT